jgi:hypothetical protein
MRKILTTLALIGLTLSGCQNDNRKYPVQGELMEDYIQDQGRGWKFYRVIVKTNNGMVTYPFIGDLEELKRLEQNFQSRKETGTKGDMVGINPVTNVFSLDEIVLTPNKIKKLK